MSREPVIEDEEYETLLQILIQEGFDPKKVRRMPQNWGKDQERWKKIKEIGSKQPLEPR